MVRLLAGTGRDVPDHRHGVGAVVRREIGRQATGAAQHHHASAQQDRLRAAAAAEDQAAQAAAAGQLQGAQLPVQVHPGEVLSVRLGPDRMRLLVFGAVLAMLLLGVAARAWAQEEISEEAPPPASVEQSVTPMERSFERAIVPAPKRRILFPGLREQLKDAPPFFRDTQVDVQLRSYYLNGGNFNGTRNEAWAGGGSLSYKSGWLFDRLSVGAVLYTSQPFYAPADRDGTLLLEEGQSGYTVLGQLYARVKLLEGIFLNLYRYTYDTPYLSEHDNRMTPNTFEGYTVTGRVGGEGGDPALRFGGGYITKMKGRNDDDFIWMSRAAGAHVDRGVGVAGAHFSLGGFSFGGIDYYSEDIINIAYGEI